MPATTRSGSKSDGSNPSSTHSDKNSLSMSTANLNPHLSTIDTSSDGVSAPVSNFSQGNNAFNNDIHTEAIAATVTNVVSREFAKRKHVETQLSTAVDTSFKEIAQTMTELKSSSTLDYNRITTAMSDLKLATVGLKESTELCNAKMVSAVEGTNQGISQLVDQLALVLNVRSQSEIKVENDYVASTNVKPVVQDAATNRKSFIDTLIMGKPSTLPLPDTKSSMPRHSDQESFISYDCDSQQNCTNNGSTTAVNCPNPSVPHKNPPATNSHDPSTNDKLFNVNEFSLLIDEKIRYNDIDAQLAKVTLVDDSMFELEQFYTRLLLCISLGFKSPLRTLPAYRDLDQDI